MIDQHLECIQQLADEFGLDQQSMCGFLVLALVTTISNNDDVDTTIADNHHHNDNDGGDEDYDVQDAVLSSQSSRRILDRLKRHHVMFYHGLCNDVKRTFCNMMTNLSLMEPTMPNLVDACPQESIVV